MSESVFKSAKVYLNNTFCHRCDKYGYCHQGKSDDMTDCLHLSVYLAGYSDAVDYFSKILASKPYNLKESVRLNCEGK